MLIQKNKPEDCMVIAEVSDNGKFKIRKWEKKCQN